ncbi:MHC class II transactivator [Syngnathoides biaculeatus]|uniref:MHC class II transactivator n=1 Tax=Syngnathoides biaculeatus TaxID=300417 RepID=UPI002ADD46B7|nr:MHC class II transactivator [Syngnathoides biaculeatus]
MQDVDQDPIFCPDYGALPDDLSEFMNDSYLVKILDTDGLFSDDPTLIFDDNNFSDTPLAKEPDPCRNQQEDKIKPTRKQNIPQKRPRAFTLPKHRTMGKNNCTPKKQKAEGTGGGSVQREGHLSCPSTLPQSILPFQQYNQFVTSPDVTSYQFKTQTICPSVIRLSFPKAALPLYVLVPVPPSPSAYELQVPYIFPEDSAVVPALMSSSPFGTLSDNTSKVMSPPCNYETAKSNVSTAVRQSPATFEIPQIVKNYIKMAKAHMHQICEEMEPGLNLSSHFLDVKAIQREMFCSGKKYKSLHKELVSMGDMDRQKNLIKLSQIFENSNGNKPKRYILLIGKAGMGKTTLIRKLCQDWARDSIPQFDFVFLLNGAHLISSKKSHYSLQTLLLDVPTFAISPINIEEVYAQVLKAPKRVLIIFDGFGDQDYEILFREKDFAALLEKDTKGKVFTVRKLYSAILQRVVLPGSILLISARPKGTAYHLVQRLDSLLETSGFTPLNVETYFSRYFDDPNLRESVLKHLEKCSYLRHLCWNPGLCRLVCLVLEHSAGSESLPRTLTELCHQVLCIKMKNNNWGCCTQAKAQAQITLQSSRQESKRAQVRKRARWSTKGKSQIPDEVLQTAQRKICEKNIISRLSSLAWEGVKANTSILPKEVRLCSKLKTFGLRKGVFLIYQGSANQVCSLCESEGVEGEQETIESENAQRRNQQTTDFEENDDVLVWADPFIQSYLAGLHLSMNRNVMNQNLFQKPPSLSGPKGRRRPEGELQELTRRFAFSIQFLSRTELRRLHLDTNPNKQALISEHLKGLSLADLCPDQVLEACHYVFEASFSCGNGGSDSGKETLVTHLSANLPEFLTFRGIPLGPPDAYVVHKILERAENGGRGFSLDLEDTGIPISGLRSLVGLGSCSTYRACIADVIALWEQLEQSGESRPLQHFVTKLKLHPLKVIQVSQIEHLGKLVNIHIHRRLSCRPREPDPILDEGVPAVKELYKLELAIGPERGPQAIPRLWEFLPNLHDLQHLDLEENKIGDQGAEQLADTFSSLCFLQILNLSQNCIGDNGVKKMVTALKDLPKLHCLILYSNVISDEGASTLAAVLPHMASLTDLDVKYNKLSDVGAQCLGASLRQCKKMKTLRLWNQCIPYGVFERLQQQDPRILWH